MYDQYAVAGVHLALRLKAGRGNGLEKEVLFSLFQFFKTFLCKFFDLVAGDLLYFFFYYSLPDLFQLIRTVTDEVFLEGKECVGLAYVFYLS